MMRKSRNVLSEASETERLWQHIDRDRYGTFELTEGIRPSLGLKIVPREGYRLDTYQGMPVVAAAVTRHKLWTVFLELLDALDAGEGEVDVVLESSHNSLVDKHVDFYRRDIEAVILRSVLCEFEDLLLRDGYAGITVLRPQVPVEVQFDSHKLLFAYAKNVKPFVAVMEAHGIPHDETLRLISEGEHIHLTKEQFQTEFEEMTTRCNAEAS